MSAGTNQQAPCKSIRYIVLTSSEDPGDPLEQRKPGVQAEFPHAWPKVGPQQGSAGGKNKKQRNRGWANREGSFQFPGRSRRLQGEHAGAAPAESQGSCRAHDWRPPPGPSRFSAQSPAATITAAAACWRASPARVPALRAPCTSPAAAARESESQAAPAPGIAPALGSEGRARPVATPGLCAP